MMENSEQGQTLGFIVFFMSMVLCIFYIIWVFVPYHILYEWGILNLCPSKELAFHVSVCIVTLLTSVPLLYAGLTILSLPSPNSLETVVDVYSQELEVTDFMQQEIDTPDSNCKVRRSEQQEVVE